MGSGKLPGREIGRQPFKGVSLASEVSIRLLGIPDIQNLPADVVFPAKAFQLFALLGLAPDRRMLRRQVAAMLWESPTDELARSNLRQLLSRVRRAWPGMGDVLVVDDNEVRLINTSTAIDLCSFCDLKPNSFSLLGIDDLLSFRGDLLEGVDDTPDVFQHWLTRERVGLRERFFAMATAALFERTRHGRCPREDLDRIAGRMLALEPEREATYRTLIETYARSGNRDQARQCYQDLVDMLKREHHAAAPSVETRVVVSRVFGSRSSSIAMNDAPIPAERRTAPRIAFLAPQWPGNDTRGSLLLKSLIEDVANELTRYRTFVALAPHSSFQVAHDSGIPLDNSQLRADFTVSGFITPDSAGQTLALRMANCQTSEIVWAGELEVSVERLVTSFRSLVSRVARNLAEGLEREFQKDMRAMTSGIAYRHFLGGKYLAKSCDLIHVRRARKFYMAAIAEDNRFAAAYANVAWTLYNEWLLVGGVDPQLLTVANDYSERAIEYDVNDAAGYMTSAVCNLYRRDFDLADEHFKSALLLSPHSADILLARSDELGYVGDLDAAWQVFQRAIDFNPHPPDYYWWVGANIAFMRQDFAKSVELCGKMASDEAVLRMLAASHGMLGNVPVAQDYGRRIRETYPDQSARNLAQLQPHRYRERVEPFIEGLRRAGVR